jgi:hypothetical protein
MANGTILTARKSCGVHFDGRRRVDLAAKQESVTRT